ncbi:MAG: hypothetical protein PHN75_13945, partial [Syntrophales bacterium]|nr:hypothetical protein [Syntrophales bacterium]
RDLFDVSADVGEEIAQIYNGHETSFHEAVIEMIRLILDDGVKEGVFSIRDAARTASNIALVLHNLMLSFVFFKEDCEHMERDMEDLLGILFYGIVATRHHPDEVR